MTERSGKLNIKKRVGAFFIFLIVSATALFIECDVYFPEQLNIYEGNKIETPKGFSYTLEVSNTVETYGDYDATVKLFGLIPVKEVTVNVEPAVNLIPGGKAVGIKMFTKGLICVGTQEVLDEDGKKVNIAKTQDIKNGDIITGANGEELHTIEQFATIVESSGGKVLKLTVSRDNKEAEKLVTPVKTDDGYKLGIWVRDSTAGIGTITFIDNNSDTYAALGHPITDVDTGELMPVDKGSITEAEIVGVKKGSRGSPGELYGVFDAQGSGCGIITKNTNQGIYGKVLPNKSLGEGEEIPVAQSSEIKTGKARILANVSGEKVESFEIEIQRIMRYAPDDKNMIVKITDDKLLNITGGIVQGMSGSPIIQNGKLIGAVTHVFVNDPSRGYGIFIENMLDNAK